MPRSFFAPAALQAILRLAVLTVPLGGAAAADLRDPDTYGPGYAGRMFDQPDRHEQAVTRHPPRIVTRPPGYVGSDYGLGKPAFTGLGSRPDWGRSGE